MYIERLSPTKRVAPATSNSFRRSLATRFVFLAQNDGLRFGAESCAEVLAAANLLTGSTTYEWRILDEHETDHGDAICGPDEVLVLVGGLEDPWVVTSRALKTFRESMRTAARVCVIGSAVFLPLTTGLLQSKRIAVHPRFQLGVRECLLEIEIVKNVTCHHGNLSSSITTASAVRMMVELIGAREGNFTLSALSEYLGVSEATSEELCGEYWRIKRQAEGNHVVETALQIMFNHLEDTLSIIQISELLEISQRSLERAFGHKLGRSPLTVYRDLRLDRAHKLLRQTAMSQNDIAIACGFSSYRQMKRWYYQKYEELPTKTRRLSYAGIAAL
ncbi:MAG: helix-turn-helix domain-containing protein [Roseovarius sp.]